MKRLAFAVVAMSVALTGCGGTLCDDLADSFEEFSDKAKPCDEGGSEEPDTFTDEDIDQCNDNLDKCSDADRDAIKKFADCIADVPTCSPSNQDAFASASLACIVGLNVSDACNAVVGESLGRKASFINYSR